MSTDRHVLSLKRKTAYARTRDKKTPLRGGAEPFQGTENNNVDDEIIMPHSPYHRDAVSAPSIH